MTVEVCVDEITITEICAQHLVETNLRSETHIGIFERIWLAAVDTVADISPNSASFSGDSDWMLVGEGLITDISRFAFGNDIIVNGTDFVGVGECQIERPVKITRLGRSRRSI